MEKSKSVISEKNLSKGELRKLNALRKSLGEEIANEAFSKWYEQQEKGGGAAADPNIEMMEKVLNPLINKMQFPRGGGYVIRRGRGRFIIDPLE